jgi:hypothetical protein
MSIGMYIPEYYHYAKALADNTRKLVDENSNDADLGEAVRRLVSEYRKPRQNPHMEFDKPIKEESLG